MKAIKGIIGKSGSPKMFSSVCLFALSGVLFAVTSVLSLLDTFCSVRNSEFCKFVLRMYPLRIAKTVSGCATLFYSILLLVFCAGCFLLIFLSYSPKLSRLAGAIPKISAAILTVFAIGMNVIYAVYMFAGVIANLAGRNIKGIPISFLTAIILLAFSVLWMAFLPSFMKYADSLSRALKNGEYASVSIAMPICTFSVALVLCFLGFDGGSLRLNAASLCSAGAMISLGTSSILLNSCSKEKIGKAKKIYLTDYNNNLPR